MKRVYYVTLFAIVLSVSSNPVAQIQSAQQCPIHQQNPYNNPGSPFSLAANNNPQPNNDQNPIQSRSDLDGTINQLLMTKIFKNPCVQKILDPSTRLYNQNGQEVQRNLNSGATPSVVNNYFIVPPEFFSLNKTDTAITQKSGKKRRANSKTKANQSKSTSKLITSDENDTIIKEQPRTRKNNSGRKRKSRQKHEKTAKLVEETIAATNKNEDSAAKVKKSKRRRKQAAHIAAGKVLPTLEISEKATDDSSNESKVISDVNKNKKRKRPNRKNKESAVAKEDFLGSVSGEERTRIDNYTSKNKKVNKSIIENEQDSTEADVSTENLAQLKNIELPVDYVELLKDLTENRITRNSKSSKMIKSEQPAQAMSPFSDDMFKNFFPYMYFGNYFNQNSNYPFNFEQFYNPGRNNRKNRKSKNKSNEPKKDPQPKVIEITLKPKRKESTTTISPTVTEISTEEPTEYPQEVTTQSDTTATDVPMPYEFFPSQTSEEEELQSEEVNMPETESAKMSQIDPVKISKTESMPTKANLEMPPTVIEDLNEFIEPALDKEEIVPTIHKNGIIHDYYPTFHDDESYHLKDIEDDRHFYTTDRGHEELLNRDRRKYDSNNERKVTNLDVKDRINFRRGFFYKERDKIKDVNQNLSIEQHTHEKLIQESLPTKSNTEIQFKSPPLLENPDFRTIMINKETPKTNLHPQFSRVVMDADLSKEIEPKDDRIETVFAKTRVVKYGVTKDEAEDNVSVSMPTYEDDGEMKHYSDGHTTYVMAKSMGHVDDYFW